jgi:hypothetical protein
MAVEGSIPNVIGIKTTMAVVPLKPGMAPKIIPMILPEISKAIPGHFIISIRVTKKRFQSSKKYSPFT